MSTPPLPDTRHVHLNDPDLLRYALDADAPRVDDVVAAHVTACERCQSRMQRLAQADHRLQLLNEQDDWTTNARRVRGRAALQARLAAASAGWSWRRPGAAQVSAGLALCVALLVVGIGLGPRWIRRPDSIGPSVGVSTARATLARALPIPEITPGATVVTRVDELCRAQALAPSPIPVAVRESVLRAYGMEATPDHEYELDFLITPELGGSPDPRNLWPEPYHSAVWNASVKDQLESLLPRLVCTGEIDLETAQRDIAVDWIAAYKKYFKTDRPLPRQS